MMPLPSINGAQSMGISKAFYRLPKVSLTPLWIYLTKPEIAFPFIFEGTTIRCIYPWRQCDEQLSGPENSVSPFGSAIDMWMLGKHGQTRGKNRHGRGNGAWSF
jgi:hypothetical protein